MVLLEKILPFSSKGASERQDSKEPSFPLHDMVYKVKVGPDVPMAAAQKEASPRAISVHSGGRN